MSLSATKYVNNYRLVSGTVAVQDNDCVLACVTSDVAVTINLPSIPSGNWNTNWKLYVYDNSGNAATNNITLVAGTGQTINGAATLVISTNSGKVIIQISSNSSFNALSSFSGGVTQAYTTVQDEGSSLTQRSILNFIGSNVTVTDNSGAGRTDVTISVPTIYYQTIYDHAVALTQRAAIDFEGNAVSLLDTVAGTIITINAYATVQDESVSLPQRSTMNFVGNGVLVTDSGGKTAVAINGISVKNTVFVSKNGNDSTGLVESMDYPFLTITAARAAALAAFTSRTQTDRVLVKVATGNYTDKIIVDDFIDYDLSDSIITTPAGHNCIEDNGSAYTACTSGAFTSMIYGNATLISSLANYACISITSTNSGNLRLFVSCSKVTSAIFEAIIISTGYLCVYANYIYIDNANTATSQCINLATDISYSVLPTIEVYNAKIYTNQSGSINSVIEFSNANPTLNVGYGKCMLVNCEVGCWSSTRAAINCDATGTGVGQITLKDTLIYSATTPSIKDEGSVSAVIKVYAYGSYSSTAPVFVNGTSGYVVGTLTVNSSLVFNQGNVIP